MADASPAAPPALLVVACSRRKRGDTEPLPALERYDGPLFRLLRRRAREAPAGARPVTVRILSAEYGLIPPERPIPAYDRRMDAARARALRPAALAALEAAWHAGDHDELWLCLGARYRAALAGCEAVLPPDTPVRAFAGPIGKRLAALYDGLYGAPPAAPPAHRRPGDAVRLRGVALAATPEEVAALARRALAEGRGAPDAYQSWYVPLDGRRVAPKWLVSCLTGLPVGAFGTGEARRALAALGVEVRRA